MCWIPILRYSSAKIIHLSLNRGLILTLKVMHLLMFGVHFELNWCRFFTPQSILCRYQMSLDCTVPHIYQELKATDMKYKNRVRSRISNLKDPKNPGLRRNVLAGSIELSRIASMSAEVNGKTSSREDQAPHSRLCLFLVVCGLCRKWPVTSWSSWGTLWPRRPSGSTKWPKPAAPPPTCCSAASARKRTAPTTR